MRRPQRGKQARQAQGEDREKRAGGQKGDPASTLNPMLDETLSVTGGIMGSVIQVKTSEIRHYFAPQPASQPAMSAVIASKQGSKASKKREESPTPIHDEIYDARNPSFHPSSRFPSLAKHKAIVMPSVPNGNDKTIQHRKGTILASFDGLPA
ncbi:uncharacterized protein BCR38DRAFT_414141 [Pseudomassariella vexata]|uniref:Uncharacterized protein n=1 Tax=Pseudomassariella vexata TaxID=1141098 RepID=A0A1Y2DDX8_9PEZI|nr:uncharacterized protein BCR38DRAFT_414141 [Pseudomassariella vexata]ORY57304.1 hypothetical protein BCR38DRAFT_414141 [Pseudomassariella vexata]